MQMRAAEHKTKSEVALDALRLALIRGELGEDRRLRLAELQESLGMSSTPIREAIRILETEGLLQNEPHRGVRVRSLTLSEVAELYMLRAPLERLAGELAAHGITDQQLRALERAQAKFSRASSRGDDAAMTRSNTDFHYVIYAAAGSRQLERIISQLWVPYSWGARWALTGGAESVHEHAGIVESLRKRAAKQAGDRLERHTLRVYKAITEHERRTRALDDGGRPGAHVQSCLCGLQPAPTHVRRGWRKEPAHAPSRVRGDGGHLWYELGLEFLPLRQVDELIEGIELREEIRQLIQRVGCLQCTAELY